LKLPVVLDQHFPGVGAGVVQDLDHENHVEEEQGPGDEVHEVPVRALDPTKVHRIDNYHGYKVNKEREKVRL